MLDRVKKLADKHGRKVSLVGWSLGGIYARQLAKMLPDEVRGVITLGSPFNGDPRATNAWKLYEFTSGHKVDDRERHMGGAISDPPPVPTTAIYSRSDGICAWQNCWRTTCRTPRASKWRQPLRAWPSPGRRLRRRRPPGAAGRPVEKIRPRGLKALFFPDPKRA